MRAKRYALLQRIRHPPNPISMVYLITMYWPRLRSFFIQYDLEGVFHTLLHALTNSGMYTGAVMSVVGELISVQAAQNHSNRGRPKNKIHDPHHSSPAKTKTKWDGKKRRTYRLTTGIYITYTMYLLQYTRSDAPPPQKKAAAIEIAQNMYHNGLAPRLQTLYKKLSDSYCRGLKIVRHHDPVQSACHVPPPNAWLKIPPKGEFLQQSRPVDTVNLLFEDDTKQLQTNPDVPPKQATPPPALCRRTCRQTPCPHCRQRSSTI